MDGLIRVNYYFCAVTVIPLPCLGVKNTLQIGDHNPSKKLLAAANLEFIRTINMETSVPDYISTDEDDVDVDVELNANKVRVDKPKEINVNDISFGNVENREIFDWIEEIVGSQFTCHNSIDSKSEKKSNKIDGNGNRFSLVEFELGKDEASDDDLLRCSLGEGMVIPLRVVYILDGVKHSEKLIMRLPTYFFDYAEDVNNDSTALIITVHTHETYFYSHIVKGIQDFIRSEGVVDLKLAIPQCVYVKHSPKYEMRKTPALIENLMEAKSLLVVSDPKGDGFKELESVEDVNLEKGLSVMTEMAKIHAVTWSMQEKMGKRLNDIWEDLLSVTDQEAINDVNYIDAHVIEGSFEFFANGYDDIESDDHPLYAMLLYQRPKIERIVKQTLYATGPEIPNSLLHMMVGGPNLFFRTKPTKVGSSHETDSDTEEADPDECCIASWNLATIGNPILDVALFTSVSLMPQVRSRCKATFLERYWHVFTETAKLFGLEPKFTFEYVCQEFEKFQIWCFLFMIAACKQDEMKTEEMRDVLETILDILPNIPEKGD